MSYADVRALFDYNEETGQLVWRVAKPRIRIGMVAGHLHSGYVRVTINGKRYMAHTVIWLWMTGEWASRGVDHVDGNGTNNKWANLRKCTGRLNNANTKLRSDNRLGIKGVFVRRNCPERPYLARISVAPGKQKVLGYFATPEEAHTAYVSAAQSYFGEFARGG